MGALLGTNPQSASGGVTGTNRFGGSVFGDVNYHLGLAQAQQQYQQQNPTPAPKPQAVPKSSGWSLGRVLNDVKTGVGGFQQGLSSTSTGRALNSFVGTPIRQLGQTANQLSTTPLNLGPKPQDIIEQTAHQYDKSNPTLANAIRQHGYNQLLNESGIGMNDSKLKVGEKAVGGLANAAIMAGGGSIDKAVGSVAAKTVGKFAPKFLDGILAKAGQSGAGAAATRVALNGTKQLPLGAAYGATSAMAQGGNVKQVAQSAGENALLAGGLGAAASGAKSALGAAMNRAKAPLPAPVSALDNHIVPEAKASVGPNATVTEKINALPSDTPVTYRSASKGADIPVESMSPNHAKNALAQLKNTENPDPLVIKALAARVESQKAPSVEQAVGTKKNPTVPSAEPTNVIPKEGKLTRNLISVSGELSRQGKSGLEIANRLKKVESSTEIGQAAFLHKIPSVTGLKGENFSKFVDTLESLSKVRGKPGENVILKSLDPKTAKAVSEWSKAIPTIRNKATDAGMKVGDLGKYYFPRQYSETLGTKQGLAAAVDHLVKTGQAKTRGEAVGQLKFMKNEYSRPFANLEKSRTVDLPNYDKSRNALVRYVSGAHSKIAHAEQFGANGEVANSLIANIGAEGHNADRALKNYQIATGQYQYHNPGVDVALQKVRTYQRVTKLGLSSILNATQSVNTAADAGIMRTAAAAFKQLKTADRAYIEQTGVRVDTVINALREQAGASSKVAAGANKFQRGLGKLLNAPGFGQVERFNRGVAAVAGRDWANTLAAKGSPRSIAILRDKLGIEGDIGRKLTSDQQIQAGRSVVERTQFKTGAKDLPGWADSPMGKTVAQFRTFSYKQTDFVYNELLKEAIVNKNPVPLMRFIAVGVPTGIVAGGVRNELGGKPFYGDTKGQSFAKKLLGATFTGSSNVGGTGLAGSALFLAQNAKSPNMPAYVAGNIGGPTVGLAASTIQSYNNKTARTRLELGQVPVAGPYLKSKFTPYGSEQQRSFNTAASEPIAKALVQAKYTPTDPGDARSKSLKASNPKQYQQLLDNSNKLFAQKVTNYMKSDNYQKDTLVVRKKTLSQALSEARVKTLNDMHVKQPPKPKTVKTKSY